MRLAGKISQQLRRLACFSSPGEAWRFYRMASNAKGDCAPMPFRIRPLNGRVQYCRPGSTDPLVLLDTFAEKFHLPSVSLSNVSIVLDLGCNVGYTMSDFAHRFPEARVIGVELDAANAAL